MQGNWNRPGLQAVAVAREEATRMGCARVGSEHLLLGLFRVDDPILSRLWVQLELSPARVREQAEKTKGPGRGAPPGAELPVSSHVQAVLRHAEEEGQRLTFGEVGPAHILLGIAQEEECLAAKILSHLGQTVSDLWVHVVEAVTEEAARKRAPKPPVETPASQGKDTRVAMRQLHRAIEIAREMHAASVGTEHILIALAAEEWGIPAILLRDAGIDEARIRAEVARFQPTGGRSKHDDTMPLATHAKLVWKLAHKEAEALGHATVRAEHLFLALLKDDRGFAASVLTSLGLKLDEVRERLFALMCPEPQEV